MKARKLRVHEKRVYVKKKDGSWSWYNRGNFDDNSN
jgi:hypothetical protein